MVAPASRPPAPRFIQWPTVARAQVALQCAATSWLAIGEPESLTARLLSVGGTIGVLVGWVMALCALLASADVLVNDVLPDRWRLPMTRRHHAHLYMACGASFLWQSFVAFASTLDSALPAYYLGQAGLCGAVAWRYTLGLYRERVGDA